MNIVLVGIGGYGGSYVEPLLAGSDAGAVTLVGAVDPYPEASKFVHELRRRGIPLYASLEQFYAVSAADLAVIASPIQFHCDQTCLALAHGSHVLCEKPLCATLEEAERMLAARERANKLVAIGYQWSFNEGIQAIKRDIRSGAFGKPKRFRTLVLWPRGARYYSRGWAGKMRDDRGHPVYDSVAGNATAHYLHNMFYVLGSETDRSARPVSVTAELYRANAIENYDTAAVRAFTEDGVELLYYGSHAVLEKVGTVFRYEFEHAELTYDETEKTGVPIVARFHNGERQVYELPPSSVEQKLRSTIAAIRGEGPLLCGIEAAMSHTLCISAMQRSEIANFPEALVKRGEPYQLNDTITYVEGLNRQLNACYEQAALPAELGFDWALPGREIRLG